MSDYNFTNINKHVQKSLYNTRYYGSEKKRALLMDDGQYYMLKLPDPTRQKKREISYINNCVSEYIGCHIFAAVGIPVQDTYLGEYTMENGATKIACLCRDFKNDGITLYEAGQLELSFDDTTSLTLFSVKSLIQKMQNVDPDNIWKQYCDRLIIDAYIGNTDRHNGNWGLAVNASPVQMAPVFDCGSSLSPLLMDSELTENLAKREALTTRSALCNEHTGKYLQYGEILSSKNSDINAAIQRIVPLINLQKSYDIICPIPYISDIRKSFYQSMLETRYQEQLIPALENTLNIKKSDEYKTWNSKVISKIYQIYIEPFTHLPDNYMSKAVINGFDCSIRKNNDYIFIIDNNCCIGVFSTKKSNLNCCKFVQCMRNTGHAIDIQNIIQATKDTCIYSNESLDILTANKKLLQTKTMIDDSHSRQQEWNR